ncbi:MAG: hypothetical protein AB7U29_11980 [Desulfobulbus sp.]
MKKGTTLRLQRLSEKPLQDNTFAKNKPYCRRKNAAFRRCAGLILQQFFIGKACSICLQKQGKSCYRRKSSILYRRVFFWEEESTGFRLCILSGKTCCVLIVVPLLPQLWRSFIV